MTDALAIAETGEENTGYRFSWGLAIAGGVAATAVTFFLLTLGSGFGLLLVHPYTQTARSIPVFLTGGAIYFFVAQAFGFAVGGHLTGRLLGPLYESHVQEEFRAAAHGFVAWAVAVLSALTLITLAGMAAAGMGASTAALYGATPRAAEAATPTAYLVDQLFRPGTSGNEPARAEAGRILDAGLARGEDIAPADRDRLVALTAQQSGVSRDAAQARVDGLQSDMKARTKRAADIARRTASYVSLWIAFSLLFGAIVASYAAVLARREDDRQVPR
jgi:hypothetical protein